MADDTCQPWYGSQSELPVVCLFHPEHYIECGAESTMQYFYIPVIRACSVLCKGTQKGYT